MTEIYNCTLWEKAKNLAQERNMRMSDECPMDGICSGEKCVFLISGETDEQKLDKLREELDVIKNAPYEGVKTTELGC